MPKGFVTKGWFCSNEQQQSTGNANNNHEFRASNYSPLDVFSGDFTKLEAAVLDLSMNVQNNFRVWCDRVETFGEYDNLTSKEGEFLLNKLFDTQHCSTKVSNARSIIMDAIVHVVANVLHRETILENLLSLQTLDVIDGDGAVLVYKRLVAHFGGSQSEAESVIQQ